MWICMCKYNCVLWHNIPLTRPVFYLVRANIVSLQGNIAVLNEQVNHLSSTYLPKVSLFMYRVQRS